jgi:DNA polymerase-3 subunit gamma/tau
LNNPKFNVQGPEFRVQVRREMPYLSLYRKYRSQTFEDVMGQDHVIKTLQNAIRLGKVAHAYLFCGTRGTGKTTTARLLAKALNCEQGPTPQPCNTCPACIAITQGSAIDIIELDAASHRGIDDIRDIRENVKFPPMEMRYKVYIIDEAHQLTKDGKDAFLKTLEEPPAHVIFVLATTEPQSIPATIRSRCQEFDFRRGSLRDLRDRLRFVASSEGIEAEDPALDLIAMTAEGSWRDAISLLEQVMSYTDGRISVDDVNIVLGTVTQDFLFRLVDALADSDEKRAFEAAAEAVESGKDIQQLLKSVAQHFRNLLVALVAADLSNMTMSEQLAVGLREQAEKFDNHSLLRAIEVFTEAERDIRYSDQHRLIFELALLKAIQALRPVQREAPAIPVAPPSPAPRPAAPVRPPAPKPEEPPKAESPARPEPEPPAPAPAAPKQNLPEFDRIRERWGQVLQHLKNIDIPAHGLLGDAVPVALRDGSLVLQFKGLGQAKLIDDKSAKNIKRKALLTAIERTFGVANAGIICEAKSPDKAPAPAQVPEPSDDADLPDPFQDPGETRKEETLDIVLDEFPGASIVDENE